MEQQSGQAYAEFWRQFNPEAAADPSGRRLRTDLLDAMTDDERIQTAMHLVTRFRRNRSDRRLMRALGYLKVTGGIPLLEEAAREATPGGVEALLALWRIDRRPERVAAIVELLQPTVHGRLRRWLAGVDDVRIAAAAALGSVDTRESRAALAAAAQDPDDKVRRAARAALGRLG